MRSALFWYFTQRRLVVFCWRFGTKVDGGEILTAVFVKIYVIWDISPCRLSSLPSSSGPAVQDEGTFMFNRNARNPSPVDTCVRTSCLIEDRSEPSYCVWRVFYGSEDHCRVHKSPILDLYFSFRALWYIKTLVNTSNWTILHST